MPLLVRESMLQSVTRKSSPSVSDAAAFVPPEGAALHPLSERERQVLEAIVRRHIDHQVPVGSKALTDGLQVSSATIRAVMGSLQGRGLIHKPHSSAGRIPTDQGYRYYVDSLIRLREPSLAEREQIAARIKDAAGVDAALEEAGQVLSGLSRHACILHGPKPSAVRMKQIEFVRLRERALLVILITTDGMVQNRLVEMSEDEAKQLQSLDDPLALAKLARRLTDEIEGQTLEEVRVRLGQQIAEGQKELDALQKTAARLSAKALDRNLDDPEVKAYGEARLLEGADEQTLDRMRELIDRLQEKSKLAEMLAMSAEAPGVSIFIGAENAAQELSTLSLISAPIASQGEHFGSVGVIGPTRLDYARVVPLVEFTAASIARLLHA